MQANPHANVGAKLVRKSVRLLIRQGKKGERVRNAWSLTASRQSEFDAR